MNNLNNKHIIFIMLILLCTVLMIVIDGKAYEDENWNDGQCSCGGSWTIMNCADELVTDSEKEFMSYSHTYKCNNCERIITFTNQ